MREQGKTGGGAPSAGRGCWKGCCKGFQRSRGALQGGSSKGFQQVFQRGFLAQKGVPSRGSSGGSQLSRLSQKPWKRLSPHLWGAYHR